MQSDLWLAFLSALQHPFITRPIRRSGPRTGKIRNKPCLCGSGKKWKRCHGK